MPFFHSSLYPPPLYGKIFVEGGDSMAKVYRIDFPDEMTPRERSDVHKYIHETLGLSVLFHPDATNGMAHLTVICDRPIDFSSVVKLPDGCSTTDITGQPLAH